MYRALDVDESRAVIAENQVRSEDIPSYGLIVDDGYRTVLVFRKTTGELILIDVTDQVPAQFRQKFPAPATFWSEFGRYLVGLGTHPVATVEELASVWESGGPAAKEIMTEWVETVSEPVSTAANYVLTGLALVTLIFFVRAVK